MRNLLLICAFFGVLAVAAPSLVSQYVGQPPGQSASMARDGTARPDVGRGGNSDGIGNGMQSAAGGAENLAGGQVIVPVSRDGHFYLDAEINARRVHFMVDTGATVVALRESDAAAAGIRVSDAAYDQPVSTSNGVTYAAMAQLNSVTVEDIRVHDVPALIIRDEQLGISLLGSAFLHKLRRFEVADGSLIFEN